MPQRQRRTGVEGTASVTRPSDYSLSRRNLGRYAAVAAGFAGLAPTAAGAAPAVARQGDGRGGTVVLARAGDVVTLDPHHTNLGIAMHLMYCLYDTLTVVNEHGQVEGVLAERWEISADGLEYTFFLRQGIAFHDGTPFNAAAVKFAFDRAIDPATKTPNVSWLGPLVGSEVVDEYTVKLRLSSPFSPLLGNIASSYFSIPSPTAVRELGEDFGMHPVGTGAWTFKEWISGESITLVPNEGYHNVRSFVENKGAPYLDELVFRNIPEAQTQVAAFETGEVNALLTVPSREVKRFQDDDSYQVVISESGSGIHYIEFSMIAPPDGEYGAQWKPPFDDLRVRQAVGYAIDADDMIANVFEGLAVRNYGPVAAGMFAYKPEIEQFGFHYDPAKAKSLLDEAGWIDGDGDGVRERGDAKLEVLLWVWSGGSEEKAAQVIQNQLGQVGFKVNVESQEVGIFIARLPENLADLNYMGRGSPEPDILRGMTNAQWGIGRYRDEQYQSLVNQALETPDPAERAAIYFEASKKMLADAAMVPLWTPLTAMAVRAEVKGFSQGPFYPSAGVWDDVWVED